MRQLNASNGFIWWHMASLCGARRAKMARKEMFDLSLDMPWRKHSWSRDACLHSWHWNACALKKLLPVDVMTLLVGIQFRCSCCGSCPLYCRLDDVRLSSSLHLKTGLKKGLWALTLLLDSVQRRHHQFTRIHSRGTNSRSGSAGQGLPLLCSHSQPSASLCHRYQPTRHSSCADTLQSGSLCC